MKTIIICLIISAVCISLGKASCKLPGSSDHVIHRGETFSPPGKCIQYKCERGGAISAVACAPIATPPGRHCHITPEDRTKAYPHCCPHAHCVN